MSEDEPFLREIRAWVCVLCLDATPSECHTPGCMFWMHDAPTDDAAEALLSAVEMTALALPADPPPGPAEEP